MITLKLMNTDSTMVIENNVAAPVSRAERMEAAEKLARKTLEAANVWAEVWSHECLPVIRVEISWGDWKHDHLRADWAMEEAGFTPIGQEITEEDGSDTYSAIHNYIAPMM